MREKRARAEVVRSFQKWDEGGWHPETSGVESIEVPNRVRRARVE